MTLPGPASPWDVGSSLALTFFRAYFSVIPASPCFPGLLLLFFILALFLMETLENSSFVMLSFPHCFPSKCIPLPDPTGAKVVSYRNFQCEWRCHLLPSFPVSFSAAFFLLCYPAASARYVLTRAKKSSKIRKWSPFLQQ